MASCVTVISNMSLLISQDTVDKRVEISVGQSSWAWAEQLGMHRETLPQIYLHLLDKYWRMDSQRRFSYFLLSGVKLYPWQPTGTTENLQQKQTIIKGLKSKSCMLM